MSGRRRHVPQRTCVACRETVEKRSLIRIARTPDGVVVDPSGKAPGRGAYVHNRVDCWEAALAGPLERSLRTTLSEGDRERLRQSFEEDRDVSRA